jgi:phenylacetate-CoA ligase
LEKIMSKSEMFGLEEISIIQTRQLRKTIHYTYQRSPFYRDMLDHARINPADIKTLDDFKYLPTTSKEELVRENERFLCVRPEEIADIMMTAGSTGPALICKMSDSDLSRLAYNAQLSFMVAGVTEKDRVGITLSLDDCALAGIASYLGLRRLGATVLRLGVLPADRLFSVAEQNRVTALIGSPGYLKQAADYALDKKLNLSASSVRKLICTGEAVRHPDFTLTDRAAYLARTYNAKIFSTYINTELATVLCDCEEECGSHLHPELMHLEILNEEGKSVSEGEIGELCITPFGLSAMPVLRYRTGDCSFLRSKRCSCERSTLRLGTILGRRAEMLNVKGTRVFPAEIHEIVENQPSIHAHVLIAESENALSDRLTLLILSENQESLDQVRDRLLQRVKIEPKIRRVAGEEIAAFQPGRPGKSPRLFIDRRHSTV